MLYLYLIRHAESEVNIEKLHIGGRNLEARLTERGKLQCEKLAERLLEESTIFDGVYASTAVRAMDTAKIVCEKMHFPVETIQHSDLLLEYDQGDWQGRLRTDVYTPEVKEAIKKDPWNFRPPHGESLKDTEERMYAFVEQNLLNRDILENNFSASIFSHGLAIRCLLRNILDSSPGMTYKIVTDNTSITELRYTIDGWHPVRVNASSHLLQIGKIRPTYC